MVRRNIVEADLQQHTVLQAFDRSVDAGVGQANARAAILAGVIERRVALDGGDAVDDDGLRQPIVEILAALDVGRLIVVAAGHHRRTGRRLDADVFREPADQSVALGQRCATLQLERQAQLLPAVKALHDPIVFLDQRRRDALVFGDDPDQIGKLTMVVQEITRYPGFRPQPERGRRTSWPARIRRTARPS